MSNAKKNILQKIQVALKKTTPRPYSNVALPPKLYEYDGDKPIELLFAEKFVALKGHFVYCEHEVHFLDSLIQLAEDKNWEYLYCWDEEFQALFQQVDFRKCRLGRNLDLAHAGITRCEALIARTGSIVLSSKQAAGRSLSIFPPVHIVIAYMNQIVLEISEGINQIQRKYGQWQNLPSMVSFATGPSRTADIEKTLVLGAHGPKEVYLFLIDGNAI